MDIATSSRQIGGRLRVCKRAPLVIHPLRLEPEQQGQWVLQMYSFWISGFTKQKFSFECTGCLPWYKIKEVFFIVEQIRFISLLNGFYLSTPFCIVVFLSLTWSGECPPSLLEVFSFAFAFALASGVILITWTGLPILMIRFMYNYTLRVHVTAVE